MTADDSGKDNEMMTDGDENTTGSPRKATPNGTIEKSDGTAAVSGGGSPSPSSTPQQNNTSGGVGGGGVNSGSHPEERLVTITGNDPQQYKAQFWIYQRVAEQGYHFVDEVRLCTEISVPSKLVGRIIGKGGQNVRELQRVTGAQVKIPEECETSGASDHDETVVRIAGNFQASQAVQCRVAQMVHQFQQHSVMPIGGGHSGGGGGGQNSAARA